jgi:hypothetical protein
MNQVGQTIASRGLSCLPKSRLGGRVEKPPPDLREFPVAAGFFHEVSRAERPSQQTSKGDRPSHHPPHWHLTLQRIFHPGRRGLNQPAQFGLQLLHLAFHLPRDLAVAEVALHAAAQPRDVLGLGEIHLEQET